MDEQRRLEVLREFGVLDTPPERELDDIVQLAARLCDTPIALISLVDEERQWFKATVGLDATETPRAWAFCDHAIRSSDVLHVPDALRDQRFADSPLVRGDPHIRFYAGAPLEVCSVRLGTLCTIDREPRELSMVQRSELQSLARLVVDQFELRRAGAQLSLALARLETLEGLLPVCAGCGVIRDERAPVDASGEAPWVPIEEFLASDKTLLTRETCPTCAGAGAPGGLP